MLCSRTLREWSVDRYTSRQIPQLASSLPLPPGWEGWALTTVPCAPLSMRSIHNESSRTRTHFPGCALASASVNHIEPPIRLRVMSYPAPEVKRKGAHFLWHRGIEGESRAKRTVLYLLSVRRRKRHPRRVWKTPQLPSFRK